MGGSSSGPIPYSIGLSLIEGVGEADLSLPKKTILCIYPSIRLCEYEIAQAYKSQAQQTSNDQDVRCNVVDRADAEQAGDSEA